MLIAVNRSQESKIEAGKKERVFIKQKSTHRTELLTQEQFIERFPNFFSLEEYCWKEIYFGEKAYLDRHYNICFEDRKGNKDYIVPKDCTDLVETGIMIGKLLENKRENREILALIDTLDS